MVVAGFKLRIFTNIYEARSIDPRPCLCCQVEKRAPIFQNGA